MVSSYSVHASSKHPSLQTKKSSPTNPADTPSRLHATPSTAPDFGALVLLALGAGVVDDELEDAGAEELEDAAAEDEILEAAPALDDAEVTKPPDADTVLVTIGLGVSKELVSVVIAFGTEAVDAKLSVATKTAPLEADDAPAPAEEAASEDVASTLWTAAEA